MNGLSHDTSPAPGCLKGEIPSGDRPRYTAAEGLT
jgi:hypothetical protein